MGWKPEDDEEEEFSWKEEDEEEIDPAKGKTLSKIAPLATFAFVALGLVLFIAILGRVFRALSGAG